MMDDRHTTPENDIPEIERQIEVNATPEEVWRQVIDGALSVEWLGITVDPRPGGEVSVPGDDMIGTVEEVRRGESITWSWRRRDDDPSQVTIDIAPSERGSIVTVTERLLEYRIVGLAPIVFDRPPGPMLLAA